MSSLSEMKPLIEWEQELGVWMLDGDFSNHFIKCDKFEAYSIIRPRIIKRGWGDNENKIYKKYIGNDAAELLVTEFANGLDNPLSKISDSKDEKFLIEWENELGFFFDSIDYVEHYTKCNYNDVIKLMISLREVRAWNNRATALYQGLDEWTRLHPISTKSEVCSNPQESVEDVVEPVVQNNKIGINMKLLNISKQKVIPQNIFSLMDVSKYSKEKENVKNRLTNFFEQVKLKKKERKSIKNFKIFNIKKSKKPRKLNNNILGKAVALALTISTAASAYLVSENKYINIDNTCYDCSISDEVSIIDNNDNNMLENTLFNIPNRTILNKGILTDSTKEKNDEYNIINGDDNISKKDQKVSSIENNNDDLDEVSTIDSNANLIHLNDKVTIKEGSFIYTRKDDALDDVDRLPLYFPYSQERSVEFVVFSNNEIVTSEDKYEECLENGLSIECVYTGDGYYRTESVKVLKKA